MSNSMLIKGSKFDLGYGLEPGESAYASFTSHGANYSTGISIPTSLAEGSSNARKDGPFSFITRPIFSFFKGKQNEDVDEKASIRGDKKEGNVEETSNRGILGSVLLLIRRRIFNLWDRSSPRWSKAVTGEVFDAGSYLSKSRNRRRLDSLNSPMPTSSEYDDVAGVKRSYWPVKTAEEQGRSIYDDKFESEDGDSIRIDPSQTLRIFGRAERRMAERKMQATESNQVIERENVFARITGSVRKTVSLVAQATKDRFRGDDKSVTFNSQSKLTDPNSKLRTPQLKALPGPPQAALVNPILALPITVRSDDQSASNKEKMKLWLNEEQNTEEIPLGQQVSSQYIASDILIYALT